MKHAWAADLWVRWKRVAQKIADFQARVLLTLLYFLVAAPFGTAVRLFSDPLAIKRRRQGSLWLPSITQAVSLDNARRQF